jgi:hypothetical protein
MIIGQYRFDLAGDHCKAPAAGGSLEYYSPRLRRGVLFAFRGAATDQRTHGFRLHGLKPSSLYRLRFEDRGAAAGLVLTGQVLMRAGVEVTLELPLSSELIFFEEAG